MSEIIFNDLLDRYEQPVEGLVVYAKVRRENGVLYIDYVQADTPLRGSGAASRFMKGLMEIVRADEVKVKPICNYAAEWLRRHSEYADLLAEI